MNVDKQSLLIVGQQVPTITWRRDAFWSPTSTARKIAHSSVSLLVMDGKSMQAVRILGPHKFLAISAIEDTLLEIIQEN